VSPLARHCSFSWKMVAGVENCQRGGPVRGRSKSTGELGESPIHSPTGGASVPHFVDGCAGKQDLEIASGLSVNRHTPALWRKRFQTQGLDGVWEVQPGRGRKPSYIETKAAAIVAATLQTKPKGWTHWSCRTMASPSYRKQLSNSCQRGTKPQDRSCGRRRSKG